MPFRLCHLCKLCAINWRRWSVYSRRVDRIRRLRNENIWGGLNSEFDRLLFQTCGDPVTKPPFLEYDNCRQARVVGITMPAMYEEFREYARKTLVIIQDRARLIFNIGNYVAYVRTLSSEKGGD